MIDGLCFCGYLTYTAEIDPDSVDLRHCKDCQVLSSSAFPCDCSSFGWKLSSVNRRADDLRRLRKAAIAEISHFVRSAALRSIPDRPAATPNISVCAPARCDSFKRLLRSVPIGADHRSPWIGKLSGLPWHDTE
jgi:hypothetical protein